MSVAELELPRTLITPKALLQMPDNSAMELVDGEIVEKYVSAESSEVEGLFHTRFQIYLLDHPVAKAYPASLGYRCFPDDPDKIRKPDTTVVRLERLAKLPDTDPGFMPIVPDLAVAVITSDNTFYTVDQKIREYLEAGFPLIWVADPMIRTVTVYPGSGRPVIFTADDELTAEAVLPGFRCKVADFFPAPVTVKKG